MPHPIGRDRVETTADGTVVLLSLQPKPWSPREEASAGSPARPGTAVRWDDELYEVLRIEPRDGGGFRHVLAPWDERALVRSVVEYGAPLPPAAPSVASSAPAVPVPAAPRLAPSAERPGTGAAWARLPRPLRALGPGFAVAVGLGWLFPFRVIGEGMSFLVHELGHTVVAWLFGCTALPAVVMTIAFEQVLAAAVLIWTGLVFAAWRWRHTPLWNRALAVAAVLYPLFAFTKAYLTLFDLGGHLTEMLVAAWVLRRALRSGGPEWERHVWSFLGFYLVARNVRLFAGVAVSASARTDYLTIAITGQNDLVKVAATTGLPIEVLGAFMALLFVAVPGAAVAAALLPRRGKAA